MELLLKIDKKGRITIPSEIRRKLKIKDLVRLRIAENKLILEPVKNPLHELTLLVVDSEGDIEKDIKIFRKRAEEEIKKIVRK
ncbi:MAG: AbrB/MazE/SpoVT family DNA-binding domain-containing protein [Thermoprotei archaeon]|nr:MAG: AbrB/MazE/SpoVT family DNA-binding domain-containing protein [Thermoprotei archaeon]